MNNLFSVWFNHFPGDYLNIRCNFSQECKEYAVYEMKGPDLDAHVCKDHLFPAVQRAHRASRD